MASTKNFSTDSEPLESDLVLIDGECLLCNRFAQFVIRHDPARRFRFATLGSPAANKELGARDLPAPPSGTFVLVSGDRAYYRSEAALRLLRQLPPPWSLAGLLLVVPGGLRDPVYTLIAKLRYRIFGKIASCGILTDEEKARFL